MSCSVGNENQFTEAEENKIEVEIKRLFDDSCAGIENLDVDVAFDFFSKNPKTKYLRDGKLYSSIEKAHKQYTSWFSKPQPKKKFEFQSYEIDVLDENTAIITAVANLITLNDAVEKSKVMQIGYTLVWRKEQVGWKVINMHTSVP